jgi:L-asparaginase / beta-aspartyl-peptidase
VSALIRHAGLPLGDACEKVLRGRLEALGADAGLIALDASGNVAMPFNTAIMHRGWQAAGGEHRTAVGAPR